MNRKLIVLLIVSALALSVHAQDEEEEPVKGFDKSKLFYGGNFGIGFGSYGASINITPQVGYRFNRYFAVGTGVNFIYSKYKYDWAYYKEEYGVVGLNIFGRVYPLRVVLLQLQPEFNYVWYKLNYDNGLQDQTDRQFVPSLLAGAGAAIPMGSGAMLIMIQYDLLQQPLSPYGSNAFFTIGFNF